MGHSGPARGESEVFCAANKIGPKFFSKSHSIDSRRKLLFLNLLVLVSKSGPRVNRVCKATFFEEFSNCSGSEFASTFIIAPLFVQVNVISRVY